MNVKVECVLYNLDQMVERTGKPIPARDRLESRLMELVEGRRVPVPVFNCLEFSWRPSDKRRAYPKSIVFSDPNTSICRFYQDDIAIVKLELEELGTPDLKVIIPDSELLDERVFSFAQSKEERITIACGSRLALASVLTELGDSNEVVILWSEFCAQQGLKSPFDYTAENYGKIQGDPVLQRKVGNQVKDSRQYIERSGVSLEGVNEQEIFDRTAWYLAMYMGEGQALAEARTICLNLEDGRVPAWFQRGANGQLPILTPVDPKKFYSWRASITGEQKF